MTTTPEQIAGMLVKALRDEAAYQNSDYSTDVTTFELADTLQRIAARLEDAIKDQPNDQ